jgi:hypothetical protein
MAASCGVHVEVSIATVDSENLNLGQVLRMIFNFPGRPRGFG